jgi:hypothetical protein
MPWICIAQNSRSPEDELTQSDSLAIFQLLDSLINLESIPLSSQFALRVGYNSNINARGGAFNLDELGITTQAAFYHKSGLFLDASGYWSNQYNPVYYLTIASAGYMNYSFRNWSFLVEYNRYLYHLPKEDVPVSIIYTYNDNYSSQSFRNSFVAALFYQWRNLNIKFDYSALTGDRTGHRFNPTLSYNFRKNKWLGFDRLSIIPTFSVLLGVEQVLYYRQLFSSRLEALFRLRRNLPLFSEELQNEFGVMNYAIRFPINILKNNWGFRLSYSYNFPKRLPGETAIIEDGGSLSLSAVRYLELKPRKKL